MATKNKTTETAVDVRSFINSSVDNELLLLSFVNPKWQYLKKFINLLSQIQELVAS